MWGNCILTGMAGLKKIGLQAFGGGGTIFSVQGNYFIVSQQPDQAMLTGSRQVLIGMKAQGVSHNNNQMPMPYGGKIVHMKIKRHDAIGNYTFTIHKNGVATALTLTFNQIDGLQTLDTGGVTEVEFNQNDLLSIHSTTTKSFENNDYTVGILVALNIGETTP